MKVKTSISLSPEILVEIDREAAAGRSEFIEKVLKQHFRLKRREERDRKDAEIYARMAADPQFESDVLDYSVDPFDLGDDVEVLIDEEPLREAG